MKRILSVIMLFCLGHLMAQTYRIGDIYTAPDGSQGIVYYLFPDNSGGWVVALHDASSSCMWGITNDVPNLTNHAPAYISSVLSDTSGYSNTYYIRSYQNNSSIYAAGTVDFAHGWVLPSTAQLRTLFGQLPFIRSYVEQAGGENLEDEPYWCSTERDYYNAWYVTFEGGDVLYKFKNSKCRVRAVRSFLYSAESSTSNLTYSWSTGATTPDIVVSPSQTTTYMVTVSGIGECQDVVEQTVEVNPVHASEFTVVSTEPYTWDGNTYNYPGNYTRTYTTVKGCDSVVTLHLTVPFDPEVSITATANAICEGDDVSLQAILLNEEDMLTPPPIAIGDILCTDNSVVKPSDWPVADKTAKGIVFYVDNTGQHGWAVHLDNQGTSVKWNVSGQSSDIPALTNYSKARDAIFDFAGYANTLAIRNMGNAATYPAAYAVDFANGWYLPAAGQLRMLFSVMFTINASLQLVNGTTFQDNANWWYWSSTENQSSYACCLYNTGSITINGKTANQMVRSVRDF